jgi:hypothetical protein
LDAGGDEEEDAKEMEKRPLPVSALFVGSSKEGDPSLCSVRAESRAEPIRTIA